MILGIDASNIRSGGGLTHLVELLRAARPETHGFTKVVIWSGKATFRQIDNRPWLLKSHQSMLDRSLLHRIFWQRYRLSRLARHARCDVLFVPGGSFAGDFRPIVTMSQNLLPFEWLELKRFGWSWITLKLLLLRAAQTRTFRRADGVVFLTSYARDIVMRVAKYTAGGNRIIPHGIDERFTHPPRAQLPAQAMDRPFRILYVSIIDVYKHQVEVVAAVAALRATGIPVELDLVGPAYPPALNRLERRLSRIDPERAFVSYTGAVRYEELPDRYAAADICVFASSCENLPIILLEGMRSGLPIACSNRGPMPEILGDAGAYFDPVSSTDTARALRTLIESPEIRARLAAAAFARSLVYSWTSCADETFAYLGDVARGGQS